MEKEQPLNESPRRFVQSSTGHGLSAGRSVWGKTHNDQKTNNETTYEDNQNN
jgi:hypothetical protein